MLFDLSFYPLDRPKSQTIYDTIPYLPERNRPEALLQVLSYTPSGSEMQKGAVEQGVALVGSGFQRQALEINYQAVDFSAADYFQKMASLTGNSAVFYRQAAGVLATKADVFLRNHKDVEMAVNLLSKAPRDLPADTKQQLAKFGDKIVGNLEWRFDDCLNNWQNFLDMEHSLGASSGLLSASAQDALRNLHLKLETKISDELNSFVQKRFAAPESGISLSFSLSYALQKIDLLNEKSIDTILHVLANSKGGVSDPVGNHTEAARVAFSLKAVGLLMEKKRALSPRKDPYPANSAPALAQNMWDFARTLSPDRENLGLHAICLKKALLYANDTQRQGLGDDLKALLTDRKYDTKLRLAIASQLAPASDVELFGLDDYKRIHKISEDIAKKIQKEPKTGRSSDLRLQDGPGAKKATAQPRDDGPSF